MNSLKLPPTTRLSHVAYEVRDLDRAAEFYCDKWGLDLTEQDGSALFLRSEAPAHHVVALRAGAERRIDHVGFEVGSRDDLERIAEAASELEVPIVTPPSPSDEPGLGRVLRLADPDGHVIEFAVDMEEVADAYGARHVKPLGLDHVVLKVSDLQRSEAFYTRILGFRVSDWLQDYMTFLRCNPNHHSLAVVKGDPGMHHAAFQVRGWDDIAKGVFNLGEHGVKRYWGPGRHGPGNNLFAYFYDPEFNVVEYTCDLAQVDEQTWQPKVWKMGPGSSDLWYGPPRQVLAPPQPDSYAADPTRATTPPAGPAASPEQRR